MYMYIYIYVKIFADITLTPLDSLVLTSFCNFAFLLRDDISLKDELYKEFSSFRFFSSLVKCHH